MTALSIVDDSELFRAAVHAVAFEQSQTVAAAIYAGTVAVAMRKSLLAGGVDFTTELQVELASDRLANAAAAEVKPCDVQRLKDWLRAAWPALEMSAAATPPLEVPAEEQRVRQATIERFAKPGERAAVIAFAAAIAVARDRTSYLGREDSGVQINAMLDADHLVVLATNELDEFDIRTVGMSVGGQWWRILDRAEELEAESAA